MFIMLFAIDWQNLVWYCRYYSKEDKVQWIPGISEKRTAS